MLMAEPRSAGRRLAEREPQPALPSNERLLHGARNDRLFDLWSVVHMGTGVLMGWTMEPFLALVLMILWEPLEIFVLSPLFWKFGIEFGYESWRNSISDIVADAVGVALGFYVLRAAVDPPFLLF